MRVTTVRFGPDLWTLLENEATLSGVSVSQYIREAALARATATAAVRGDAPFELLAGGIREVERDGDDDLDRAVSVALARLSRALARVRAQEAAALRAEAELATRRAALQRGPQAPEPRG